MNDEQEYRKRLQDAVRSDGPEVPLGLETRVRASLPEPAPQVAKWKYAMAVAAVLIVAGFVVPFEQVETFFVSAGLRPALADHIHCALHRHSPETAVEDAALAAAIAGQVPGGYRIAVAHRCRYQNRRYFHLSLAGAGGPISVIATPKMAGDALESAHGGKSLRFSVDGQERAGYLIYVVSSLQQTENRALLAAFTPGVEHYLSTVAQKM